MTTSIPIDELLAHEGWLRRVVVELVDQHQVEDVLQDTWAAALARRPGRLVAPRAWLRRVAHNMAMRRRRTEVRLRQREAAVARDEAVPSTAAMVERLQAHQRIAGAVADLQEPYRTVVLLRFFEDLQPREIARRLGLPGSTVRTRIERGLDKIRRRLAGTDMRALAVLILTPRVGEPVVPATLAAAASQLMIGVTAMAARNKTLTAACLFLLAGLGVWFASGPPLLSSAEIVGTGMTVPPEDTENPGREAPDETRAPERRAVEVPAAEQQLALPLLRGQVIDPLGRPIGGVRLRFQPIDGPPSAIAYGGEVEVPRPAALVDVGISGADGRFAGPCEHEHGHLYTGDGYTTIRACTPNIRARASDEALVIAVRATTVSGVVVDEDGQPLSGVWVQSRLDGLMRITVPVDHTSLAALPRTHTLADGRFHLEGVPQLEELRLSFGKTGYETENRYGTAGQGHHYVTLPTENADAYRITGTVVDQAGQLVSGAMVLLHEQQALSGRYGEFTVSAKQLQATSHFGAGLPGFQVAARPDVVQKLLSLSPARMSDVVLRLGRPALSIRGRVRDLKGKALPDLVVSNLSAQRIQAMYTVEDFVAGRESKVENSSGRIMKVDGRTDAAGQFEIKGLSQRAYMLRIFDPATLASTTVPVEAGRRDVEIRLDVSTLRTVRGTVMTRARQPLANLELWWGLYTLEGMAAESAPEGAHVTAGMKLFAPGGHVVSDDEGRFELTGIAAGDAVLSVSGPTIVKLERSLREVADGADLVLQPWTRCRFRVKIEDQAATQIRLLDASGEALELARTMGQISFSGMEWSLKRGMTPVLEVSEAAQTMVVLGDGQEIARHTVSLSRDQVGVIHR